MARKKDRDAAPRSDKCTIQEVARLAGVTHPTVSRALAGSPQVSTETIRRVQQVAAQVGYRPNLFAQALKRGESPILGVLANSVTAPFIARIISEFEALARAAGLGCLLCDAAAEVDPRSDALGFLLDLPLRGVLLIGERTADAATLERLTLAARNGLRIVALSANIESPTIPSITVNHQSVGLIATRHLIEAGHRRIAYIGPGAERRQGNSQGAARQRGYELALTEAGLSAGATLIDDLDEVTLQAANLLLDRLTALSEPPTGVFVFNDMRALAIIGAAERRGLRVPGALAVVGVDNLAIGALVSPPLTSVEQPVRELVAAALDALVRPQGSDASRIIEPRIVPRASSGAP